MIEQGNIISLHDKCVECGKLINIEISSDGELGGDVDDVLNMLGFTKDIVGDVICILCLHKNFDAYKKEPQSINRLRGKC